MRSCQFSSGKHRGPWYVQSRWIYVSSATVKLMQHRWEVFGHSLESAVYSPAAYSLALSV